MAAEPTAVHTALQAVRVRLRGGSSDDAAQTITAELNDIGSAQEILLHTIAAIDVCASMAASAVQRLANETRQDRDVLYQQLVAAYGTIGEHGDDPI